jgi:hypothetical protein
MEYIIQFAPHELEILKREQDGVEGDVPPEVKDIRAYRVVVGNDVLPRQDSPRQASATPKVSSPVPWPGISPTPPAQTKPSSNNPFAALNSLVSRYPFGQTTSDPTKRTEENEAPRLKATGADWRFGETQPKVERPATRESPKETKEPSKETSKPWVPFTVVVLALFGSLGGNVYMGWITWETRARYHALVRRRKKGEHFRRETTYDSDTEAEEE